MTESERSSIRSDSQDGADEETTVLRAYGKALKDYTPSRRKMSLGVVVILALAALGGAGYVIAKEVTRVSATADFVSAHGIYAGDRITYLGVPVGEVDSIDPRAEGVTVKFHYDGVDVPAKAKIALVSQSLVSARTLQLTPGYTGGPTLTDGATIPRERTVVPMEWDEVREQLERVGRAIEPTTERPEGPAGELVDTASKTLYSRGDDIHKTVTELSKAMRTLSSSSPDLFSSIRNLQVFTGALASSEQSIVSANKRFADITALLSNTDGELAQAVQEISSAAPRVQEFLADNRGALKSDVQKLTAVTAEVDKNRADLEQVLHVGPTAFQNLINIYQPAQGTLTGALAVTQFQNPIQFICGAIQAASRKGAEESAKLCAQQLGPVLKQMTFNYPPIGVNPVGGLQARPEQVDYSEPWLRSLVGDSTAKKVVAKKRTVTKRQGVDGLFGLPGPGAGR